MQNIIRFICYFLLLTLVFGCKSKAILTDHTNIETSIKARLMNQQKAWNEGNIEEFMQTYWNSSELTFIGSRGPTYGWQKTLENYRKGYPDKKAMGRLHFDIIETRVISQDAAYVIGKFTLFREKDEPSGYFTLLWRKMENQWYIISDHTSG